MAEKPGRQLRKNGRVESPSADVRPDVTAGVASALDELAQLPTRRPDGTFTSGRLDGTLERSAQFWSAVEPAKRELAERVRRDQALDDDAPETLAGLVDAYCEARLFRTSMFLRLVDLGGPVTSKGKARVLYTAYLSALDREMKLAQMLGLVRKPRNVSFADAVRAAGERAE